MSHWHEHKPGDLIDGIPSPTYYWFLCDDEDCKRIACFFRLKSDEWMILITEGRKLVIHPKTATLLETKQLTESLAK